MSETQEPGSRPPNERAPIDGFCDWVREGAERVADLLTPPPSAGKHFREARLEFWRGVRDMVDHRIDHLSRNNRRQGTRVVVE